MLRQEGLEEERSSFGVLRPSPNDDKAEGNKFEEVGQSLSLNGREVCNMWLGAAICFVLRTSLPPPRPLQARAGFRTENQPFLDDSTRPRALHRRGTRPAPARRTAARDAGLFTHTTARRVSKRLAACIIGQARLLIFHLLIAASKPQVREGRGGNQSPGQSVH